MSGFEGSFLGAQDKISKEAIMECKICWTPYDPAEGDDYRQIDPGTAFGSFSATYRLLLSDEDLPGATDQELLLTLTGNVIPEPAAGFLLLGMLGGLSARRPRRGAA